MKDIHNNIIAIMKNDPTLGYIIAAQYEYDSLGNTVVTLGDGTEDADPDSIGNINPFRWKSHYYDSETGFYYVEGRYYEPARGSYIDALEATEIEGNAYDLLGLDRNGLMCLSFLRRIMRQ